MAAADGLHRRRRSNWQPVVLSFALVAYGFAFRDADPVGALDADAPGSGDRSRQRQPSQRVAPGGDSGTSLRPNTATRVRVRSPHSGDPQLPRLRATSPSPCRAGRPRRSFRPARTLRTGGHHRRFRVQSLIAAAFPEITTAITHLRDVLGEQTYESLARKGETMTTAAMVTYAYDQIDQARTELEHPS